MQEGVLAGISDPNQRQAIYSDKLFGMDTTDKLAFWVLASEGGDQSASRDQKVRYRWCCGARSEVSPQSCCGHKYPANCSRCSGPRVRGAASRICPRNSNGNPDPKGRQVLGETQGVPS